MSQVPISRLTEKVLARIFVHLQQMHQGNGAESYQWLPIVRVCKQWRSTAISCPELWSIIKFNIMPLDVAASWITRRSDNHPMGWIIGEYSKVESQNEGYIFKSRYPSSELIPVVFRRTQTILWFAQIVVTAHWQAWDRHWRTSRPIRYPQRNRSKVEIPSNSWEEAKA